MACSVPLSPSLSLFSLSQSLFFRRDLGQLIGQSQKHIQRFLRVYHNHHHYVRTYVGLHDCGSLSDGSLFFIKSPNDFPLKAETSLTKLIFVDQIPAVAKETPSKPSPNLCASFATYNENKRRNENTFIDRWVQFEKKLGTATKELEKRNEEIGAVYLDAEHAQLKGGYSRVNHWDSLRTALVSCIINSIPWFLWADGQLNQK